MCLCELLKMNDFLMLQWTYDLRNNYECLIAFTLSMNHLIMWETLIKTHVVLYFTYVSFSTVKMNPKFECLHGIKYY